MTTDFAVRVLLAICMIGSMVFFLRSVYFFVCMMGHISRKKRPLAHLFPYLIPFVSNLYDDTGRSYQRKFLVSLILAISLFAIVYHLGDA